MPSVPRTRPAGVRRTATGVVSGVGGAGSGDRACVACSECFAFEQPAPGTQTAAASNRHATHFTFFRDPAGRARTDFVAPRVSALTDFDVCRSMRKCKSLKCNEEKARPLMVRRLILWVPKKSAGMGVPAWGGAEGLPPLLSAATLRQINGLSVGDEAAPRRPLRRNARVTPGSGAPPRLSTSGSRPGPPLREPETRRGTPRSRGRSSTGSRA